MSNDKYQSVELHISSLDEQVPLTPETTPIAELGGYISGSSVSHHKDGIDWNWLSHLS